MWRFLVLLFALGCEPVLEVPGMSSGDAGEALPRFEPEGCCDVPSNFRFALPGVALAPFPMMFQGELSDYHRARLDAPLSSTLEVRRVPLGRERRGDEVWFAPMASLSDGETYSIAASEREVWTVAVHATTGSVFRRSWPRDAEPTRFAVFCAEEARREQRFRLPEGLAALAIPGDNACFGVLAEPGLEATLSPRELFGAELQPTLLSGEVTAEAAFGLPECPADESRFVIGCARVEDDRVVFRSPVGSYWMFSGAANRAVGVAAAGQGAVSGLPSESRVALSVRLFTRDGQEVVSDIQLETAPARPHVVLNELLPDANGGEPEQEWIELYNDGSEAVDLAGFRLSDSDFDAGVPLPSLMLPAQGFALVVREDFDSESLVDVPPLPSVPLLQVPSIGQYGLSNGGERWALYSPLGVPVSTVPPLPGRAGQSVARRSPECPDTAECFGQHAEPGASPGAANTVP